jgi:hypothetical protein
MDTLIKFLQNQNHMIQNKPDASCELSCGTANSAGPSILCFQYTSNIIIN